MVFNTNNTPITNKQKHIIISKPEPLKKWVFSQGEHNQKFTFPSIPIWASLWENRIFAYAKTKTQISFAVTAKLISAFVFAIQIVQSLYYLNPKFQASNYLLWLYSPVCVGPGRNPRRPVFSERGSFMTNIITNELCIIKTCLRVFWPHYRTNSVTVTSKLTLREQEAT